MIIGPVMRFGCILPYHYVYVARVGSMTTANASSDGLMLRGLCFVGGMAGW